MTSDTPSRPGIVLIGCGEIGKTAHLPGLALLQHAGVLELVGVCDLVPGIPIASAGMA